MEANTSGDVRRRSFSTATEAPLLFPVPVEATADVKRRGVTVPTDEALTGLVLVVAVRADDVATVACTAVLC